MYTYMDVLSEINLILDIINYYAMYGGATVVKADYRLRGEAPLFVVLESVSRDGRTDGERETGEREGGVKSNLSVLKCVFTFVENCPQVHECK